MLFRQGPPCAAMMLAAKAGETTLGKPKKNGEHGDQIQVASHNQTWQLKIHDKSCFKWETYPHGGYATAMITRGYLFVSCFSYPVFHKHGDTMIHHDLR